MKSGSEMRKLLINTTTDSKTNINGEFRSPKIISIDNVASKNNIDKYNPNFCFENIRSEILKRITNRIDTMTSIKSPSYG